MTKILFDDTLPSATTDEVNAERDRRLRAGFAYKGKMIQADMTSQTNIAVRAQTAKVSIDAGMRAGNLRWAYTDRDFTWTTADNTALPLDAPSMIIMQQMAAAFLSDMNSTGAALKARLRAGERIVNIKADALWPQS